jgi:RNA polymerase Rpb1, domain 5
MDPLEHSWADEVDEEERKGSTWADVVKSNLTGYQSFIEEDDEVFVDDIMGEAGETIDTLENVPGDPVGIRAIQSILMSATQMSLSHFHTAGMDGIVTRKSSPSVADAMNSVYTSSNTSMTFTSTDEVYALRRQLVGANLMYFVNTVGSNITGLPDRENVWYDVLEKPMYDGIVLRIYVDYDKMRNHGLTLADLARESFGEQSTDVSPDFMGMIDVNVPDMYMSQWLSRMSNTVCGTEHILSCDKVEGSNRVVTKGTDVLAVSRVPSVDNKTITSNNAIEMERHFGIEAAASVLRELTGSQIVSDFMTRTGRVLSFMKNSTEVQNKGIMTSMGFERPRDDIRRSIISRDQGQEATSVYECMITGVDPYCLFQLIQDSDT